MTTENAESAESAETVGVGRKHFLSADDADYADGGLTGREALDNHR